MNFKKSIATLVLTCLLFVGCKEKETDIASKETAETTAPKVKKEIAAANLQTASFSVEGMTCAVGCAKTIQEDLTAQDGVQKATVDFDTKMATVTFDKTVQTPEKLTTVVEAAADGKTYKVSKMKS
ncbi:heavy-metal-associated domain-containing protein [Flavobacterium sp. GSP27]|uniref:Heavy-metal-associated domain-containing protein n=1 Tax=Flavobacterium bomense TaxID=2497483 RepID=A0A432CTC8_9FLAO|nr:MULTISPECIES: heavy metal-associated domain-containing protein [Flavobacterium]RTY94415.1 heavy-metal-associated domain-containing protein [Flavobacterium sp. GSN2]RTY89901.1 heavy-metal-associated domain-containing protein [Flavobacterium sp. RSP46]RTZ08225.1 heavy-metal-associated domain-containing protein [Flavobacterium bomense]RTZ09377.1 heavy-metal-associated domain-containing protein [Flavobacterium sp. GSP6]RTZ10163.1 heavy-metal-associated domain-containing protein [Flavobacterium 